MKKHKHVLKNCTSKIYKKKQYNGYKKRTAKNMQKHKQITEKPGLAAGRYKDCVGNTSSGGGTQNTTDETKDKNPGRESQ